MKTNLLWVAIGFLLAVIGFLTFTTLSSKSKARALTAEIEAYRSAKPDTVIKVDSVTLPGEVVIKPVPVPFKVPDTVWRYLPSLTYDSTFRQSGIRFRWRAAGFLDSLTFSDFVFPKEIVTITTHLDTCFQKPPEYRAKFLHYGLYTEMNLRNFAEFPGIGAGVQIIVKDRLTVGAGVMVQKNVYGNIRIGLLFK